MQFMYPEIYKILTDLNAIDLHRIYLFAKEKSLIKGQNTLQINCQTTEDKFNFIYKFFYLQDRNGPGYMELMRLLSLKESAKEYENHTSWIDAKNKILCTYLWLLLSNGRFPQADSNMSLSAELHTNIFPSYVSMELPSGPTNSSECLQWFNDYFYLLPYQLEIKIKFLKQFRQDWEYQLKFKHKMLRRLEDDNDEVTSWFWNYMQFSDYNYPLPANFNFDTFQDKLALTFGMIYFMRLSYAEKIIKLDKAYSAYHSKKFKEKPKHLQGENFWLGSQELRMLNSISTRNKLSDKDCLRKLIHDAYLKVEK